MPIRDDGIRYFTVTLPDEFGNNKQYYRQSVKWKTESDVEKARLKFIKNHKPTNVKVTTLSELSDVFFKDLKTKVKLRSFREHELTYKNHIEPFFGDKKLSKISSNLIKSFHEYTLNKVNERTGEVFKWRTVEKMQVLFRQMLRYAYKEGYIDNYRITDYELTRRNTTEEKTKIHVLTPKDFKEFETVLDNLYDKLFYNMLFWCGIRIGENIALLNSDINLKSKTVEISKTFDNFNNLITTPKTSKSYRIIDLPDVVIDLLEQVFEEKEKVGYSLSDPLYGRYIPQSTMYNRHLKYIYKSGIEHFRFHDLRHSHISLLIDLGFNAFEISRRSGNSVNMINETYGHLFDRKRKAMVEALNKSVE